MLGDIRKTPRLSAIVTFLSCDLPKIEPSIRPMRMRRPGAVAAVAEIGPRPRVHRAAVEGRHHAEIAAELLQANARLEREFGEPAAADRIAVHVLGAELLVAIAAYRTAAAGIEPARGRDVEQAGSEDCPKPNPPRGNDAIRDGVVGAGVDLGSPVAEMAAVEGDFRAQPAAETEAAGRIEQAVAVVIAEAERHRRDQEAARVLEPGTAEHAALNRAEPLAAVGPSPFLLPDKVALPLDVAGEVDGLGA